MSSREQILAGVKRNQPALEKLPEIPAFAPFFEDVVAKYTEMITFIGGNIVFAKDYGEIADYVKEHLAKGRIIATPPELASIAESNTNFDDPHSLENTELAIIQAHFGVAENGALWVTADHLPQRALPLITQQLAIVVKKETLVPTMHDAYKIIGAANYDYGAFIAGPSKSADIAQSLVLGAHGPKAMTVFVLG